MYVRSLNMTDLRGIVVVVLVVGCGYGQYLGGHQHFKYLNGTRTEKKKNIKGDIYTTL